MSIMELPEFNKKDLMKKLKNIKNRPNTLLTIIEFIFSPPIEHLMAELDSQFDSKYGRPAYPRKMILGVLLYCFHLGIEDLIDIERECNKNIFLQIFTCNTQPKKSTFTRFLKQTDPILIKKVFIATLVKLNDLRFLNFSKIFIDGTDAIVNGSKNHKISLEEIEIMKQVKKWKLLHNNTKQGINKTKKGLEEKLEIYAHDEKKLKQINQALKHIELYNITLYKKRNQFKRLLLESNKKYLCITSPHSVMMKTKKGTYDFALNLQEMMIENHIIFSGVLLEQPNDHHVMKDLLKDIKETYEILVEMQEEFGERRNFKELQKRIDELMIIADSGYSSNETLYILKESNINGLIMTKGIAQQINNEIRENNDFDKKLGKDPEKSKKNFIRVKNGYICPKKEYLTLVDEKEVNFRKKDVSKLPYELVERRYIFESSKCATCEKCETCVFKRIEERITPLQYEMIEKLTNKRYKKIYQQRFFISEGINGFLKSTNGIFKLLCSSKNSVNNELQLRNTVYNLIRTVNLKGTAY